ncbi:MAG: hypothetical protein ACI8T1_000405 [Verrucomicrobiales bacterium]|jgi:hypothetical protein
MRNDSAFIEVDLDQFADELEQVVDSDRPTAEFWASLLASYCRLSGARQALALVRRRGSETWRGAAEHTTPDRSAKSAPIPKPEFHQLAVQAAEIALVTSGKPVPMGSDGHCLVGVRLRLLTADDTCVAVFLFDAQSDKQLGEVIGRLQLVSGAPRSYQMQQAVRSSKQDVEKFAKVFDLLVPVNEERRFLAAALAFCNGIANSLECDRASLGWYENGYTKLKAISRTEKFDRQMAAAQALETAMDETLDQDEVILWPTPEHQAVIARDHQKLSRSQGAAHLVSLPLRHDGEAVAVLLCERDNRPFSLTETQQLRLACDLATPRLADLKRYDRWFGARWLTRLKEFFASLLGPEHTWAKVLALTIMILLVMLIFVKVDYRVEGDFIMRSNEVVYLTTPYDGYIEEVHQEAGGVVKAGDLLLTLQTDELRLQEAAELADVTSYARQSERARATNQLADMRIAEARKQQVDARLAIVRHRLAQAEVRAPFDAVIIEGDLRELRGKPIEKGNPLFKLAQLEGMFAEVDIDERNVHEILDSKTGEIAFVGRPQFKYPVTVTKLETAAFPKNEGNVFQMRCEPVEAAEAWWRPGMTGVCKVAVEKRSLLWVFGHRTVEFFRLWLWW